MAAGDAWVDPVSQVTTGSTDAPVNMTVYRFVSWRDEECRVTDLSGLGVGDLSTEISAVPTLNSLLGSLLSALLSGLGSQDKSLLNALNNRVTALQSALGSRQSQLSGALDGVSQLDLCDLDSQTLQSLQELGDLAPVAPRPDVAARRPAERPAFRLSAELLPQQPGEDADHRRQQPARLHVRHRAPTPRPSSIPTSTG